MYEWLRRVLSRPRADVVVLAIGIALALPSIPTGIAADDYIHELAVRGSGEIPGFVRSPLDLFRFATGTFTKQLVDEGVLPWWTDLKINFAFFRPISSATHWFDHVVLQDSAPLMHAHTIFWATLTLLAARAIYALVDGPGWGAVLALAFYAFDDARGPPIAWIANRNAFVACALSAWAFYLYLRGRGGHRGALFAAPLLYGVSLLAGEGAIAITPYLFAHALFVQEGPLVRRLSTLLPYVGVTLAWALVYRSLGYGISGSGIYFDPFREPGQFLLYLPERFTMLWFAQLGGPWSEFWNGYAVMFPGVEVVIAVLAVLALSGAALIFAPTVRRDPVARFWLVGAALATLPACGAFPADRLLPWASLGAMGLTARFFRHFVDSPPAGFELRTARVGAVLAVATHLVVGPLVFPLRVTGNIQVRDSILRAESSVPKDAAIAAQRLIYVNPPADPFASYVPVMRAVHGEPRARSQAWLSDGTTDVKITRVDERTLRIEPDRGYMLMTSEQLFRNVRLRPFRPGDAVTLPDLVVEIESTMDDGRPRSTLARFNRPLESPDFRFLEWKADGYGPFTLPAVGETRTLPAANLVRVLYGPDSAVSAWFDKKS